MIITDVYCDPDYELSAASKQVTWRASESIMKLFIVTLVSGIVSQP